MQRAVTELNLLADGSWLWRHFCPGLLDNLSLLGAEGRRSVGVLVDNAAVATELDLGWTDLSGGRVWAAAVVTTTHCHVVWIRAAHRRHHSSSVTLLTTLYHTSYMLTALSNIGLQAGPKMARFLHAFTLPNVNRYSTELQLQKSSCFQLLLFKTLTFHKVV